MADNYFAQLNSINVNDKVEKKNGLTYLSWAYAWAEIKKLHPKSFYTVYENRDGWNYFTDGQTCWVKTGVTVVYSEIDTWDENGVTVGADKDVAIEHIEYLPVMDFKNKSIPLGQVTSFDVNKAIQRSLTKAVARHGLGLYIYAGEDLPEEEAAKKEDESTKKKAETKKETPAPKKEEGPAKITRTMEIELGDKIGADVLVGRKILEAYKIKSIKELNTKQFNQIMNNWDVLVESAHRKEEK